MRSVILYGSDYVDRCEESTESERKARGLGWEVDGHDGGHRVLTDAVMDNFQVIPGSWF